MPKNWQILNKISESLISKFPEYDRLTLQLLANRDLTEKTKIEEFLSADYEKYSHDPFLFRGMRAAVELIIAKIKAQEKITVYGDYDADGVTASAIMLEVLKTLRAYTQVYIPDRVSEGYGLNREAIKEIADGGSRLIVTVDNGIRGREEVNNAKSLGLEVVVTDHHVAPETAAELPDCLVIDPIVPGESYPFKYLAGVGTAFKLATALIRSSTLTPADQKKLEEKCLDLVAIGTIADCVPLIEENRALVKRGLAILNKTKRLGLLKLIEAAAINNGRALDAWNIGFQLAPRLNAAGRMDHANTAFELLTTKDKTEAEALAKNLNDKNIDRQRETEAVMRAAEAQIDRQRDGRIIIALSPSLTGGEEIWNEGVIGLAAGRLMEKYYLPVLVITGNEAEMKGSGRSIPEFNLIEAVEQVHGNLLRYGGHAAACGFSIEGQDNLRKFSEQLTRLANDTLAKLEPSRKIIVDAEIPFADANEKLVEIVDKFAPFGEANDRPKFLSRGLKIVDLVNLGSDGRHLKLRLKSDGSPALSALGFGQAERWPDLKIGDTIDLVYHIEMNEFNGRRDVQLKIIDLRLASPDSIY